LRLDPGLKVTPWQHAASSRSRAIVVHAGSGRELANVVSFCQRTNSTLIELSTGSGLETSAPTFPVILCPNTNLLMLKFMSMLSRSGHLFQPYDIRITESHQAGKTSTPGTAVAMAQSLGKAVNDIVSIRDPKEQSTALQIPREHLARHAYHRVTISDAVCRISMETRVYGPSPYAAGVSQIIAAVQARALEPRTYRINEFIENGWV
jgi:4-hydroxy-tetrahydrodipicolinate reductase